MKTKNRFLKGAIRFVGTLVAIFYLQANYDLTHLSFVLSDYLKSLFGDDVGGLVMLSIFIFSGYMFFYLLISGAYYMVAWEYSIPIFESKGRGKEIVVYGNSDYENINRILAYRESKLGLMTNDEAQKYLMETSKLDNLYRSSGANTQKTLTYINAKLGMMSNDTGIDYLRGKL